MVTEQMFYFKALCEFPTGGRLRFVEQSSADKDDGRINVLRPIDELRRISVLRPAGEAPQACGMAKEARWICAWSR
jgi:hypothetical protein